MADSEKGPASIGALIDQHSNHHVASPSVTENSAIPRRWRRRRDAARRLPPVGGSWSVPTPRACPATSRANAAAYEHFATLGLLSEVVVDVLAEVDA